MGKIQVKDLAQMMGIAEQDLVFKLKSIGVRLDDENPKIDKEVIEAVLQGKSLRHPREVILRDKEAQATAPTARKRPPTRRAPLGPRRPPRRRTIIQRVEPRIKAIPATEKPKPAETTASGAPASAPPAASEGARPGETRGTAPARDRKDKQRKVARPPVPSGPRDEDLRTYKGSLAEIEEAADSADETRTPISARQKRRAERKQRQSSDALEFKDEAPEGRGRGGGGAPRGWDPVSPRGNPVDKGHLWRAVGALPGLTRKQSRPLVMRNPDGE